MKQYLTFPAVTILLIACSSTPMPNQVTPSAVYGTATPTAQPIQTSTYTPVGTWEMVIHGVVYDQSMGEPISGASVSYIVVHSYFPEIQEGRLKKTISDDHGEFSLSMIVHDTDNIKLLVDADTYIAYEKKLDLFGNRSFNIELSPFATPTVSAP